MDYYRITPQELGQDARIPILKLGDSGEVFYELAKEMVDTIRQNNRAGRRTVFICPVGPVGQYPIFRRLVREENLSLQNCWFLNMDEYLGEDGKWLPKEHPLSFRGFMEREVYSQIRPELNVPEGQRVFPDPDNLAYIPELIEKLGGVDVCFGGIGLNGHLAFNEADPSKSPEEFIALKTRVLPISPETRAANAIGDFGGALEDMPGYCVTIGFHEIYHARKIRLGVFRNWHRGVVRRAAYGAPSAEFPVSLLQGREDVLIRMTGMVAE